MRAAPIAIPSARTGMVAANARRRTRPWISIALHLLLAVIMPTAALAHGKLKSSSPTAGAHLGVAPRELRLSFTEAPQLAFTKITLAGPDGQTVALGPVRTSRESRQVVVAAVMGPLKAGTYTVAWQMGGADGHPVRGRYEFIIAPGASGLSAATPPPSAAVGGAAGAAVVAPGQTAPPAAHHDAASMPTGSGFDAGSPLYVAVRWLLFAGLLVVLGAVAFRFAVLGLLQRANPDSSLVAPARDRAARLGLFGAWIVAIALVLRLLAQSYAMHGVAEAFDGSLIWGMLSTTVWGWGWWLQLGGLLLTIVGFATARRGALHGWMLSAFGVAVLAFSPGLSGHAAAAPRLTPLAIASDGLHVIGAGGWLGSLLVLILVGIPVALTLRADERGPAVAELVNAFSPTALAFAGITAATGLFAAWLHVGAVSALWETTYGKTLLTKLAILSIVAATGAYNWLRVKPLLGDVAGASRMRRSATVEVAVGVVVLIVTAVLVATPTPMDMGDMAAAASP